MRRTATVLPSPGTAMQYFLWTDHLCCALIKGKPCGSHIHNTFLIWELENSILGRVPWVLLSIQATISMLILLLLHCPHI